MTHIDDVGGFIRPYTPDDFDRVYEINCQSTPGVSEETQDGLRDILSIGQCLVGGFLDGELAGFVSVIEPGTSAYKSPNLRWFERWQAEQGLSLIYVDRIALGAETRGRGLGAEFYSLLAKMYEDRDGIAAEVNTLPDNSGSHRFHLREGFERVGDQQFTPEKAVAYYVRKL